MADHRPWLERLYARYNSRRFVPPDPLAALYRFPDVRDREIVGLIAAGLAYGNVKAIVASLDRALEPLGPNPRRWIETSTDPEIRAALRSFRHRWTTGEEIAAWLIAIRQVCGRSGTLGELLAASIRPEDGDIQPALIRWHAGLKAAGVGDDNSLLPDPARPSASKRLHLYLRWMVRQDAVDPGGWPVRPALLLMPVDVHIHRIARRLRFTRRRAADLRTAREITAGFRRISPEDPIRYDFALTRLPLHEGLRGGRLLDALKAAAAGDV